MVNIQPFKAVRYNSAKINDLDLVISPPSDSISTAEQARFFKRNPYNFMHLDLAKTLHSHQAAGDTLRQWVEQRVLLQDQEPAFYF